MKLVHQKIIDSTRGDCMQCSLCSLLDLEYHQITDLFKNGPLGFWYELENSLGTLGYKVKQTLYNPMINELYNPTNYCFTERPEDEYSEDLLLDNLHSYEGINKLYIGVVLSPGYFKWYDDLWTATHAVVINEDCNIVHDPNPNYMELKEYPLSKVLGFNGVIKAYIIEKI